MLNKSRTSQNIVAKHFVFNFILYNFKQVNKQEFSSLTLTKCTILTRDNISTEYLC